MKVRVVLCLLLLASLFGVFLVRTPNPVVAASDYGCGTTLDGDPIGGGSGYTPVYTAGGADHVVSSAADLKTTLAAATAGEVIYIADGATITFDASNYYGTVGGGYYVGCYVKAGVTLAGGRSGVGTAAVLKWSASYVCPNAEVLVWCEDNTTVSGLNLFGANETTTIITGKKGYGVRAGNNTEVANCEIHGCTHGGVVVLQGIMDVWVHHNYIHHNQQSGYGYGVVLYPLNSAHECSAIVEGNHFAYGRHMVVGGVGRAHWIARYNYIDGGCTSSVFDQHGSDDTSPPGNPYYSAGGQIEIYNNTSTLTGQHFVNIRGQPYSSDNIEVHHNWSYNTASTGGASGVIQQFSHTPGLMYCAYDGLAGQSGGAFIQMYSYDNWWGPTAPPENPPPNEYHLTASAPGENITDNSAVLCGSVSGPFDNQTVDNVGFVWDTVSRADPGNVAPAASSYANTWSDNTDYTENSTIYHAMTGTAGETYYVRFAVDWIPPGDWEYSDEFEFTLSPAPADPYADELQGPKDFVATAINGESVTLSWTNVNDPVIFPDLETVIRVKKWSYPDDPPSLSDNSTLVYEGPASPEGYHSYSLNGLSAGQTYYFRIWFYDPETYTMYAESFATTYAGIGQPVDVNTPDNWFIDPTCDMWEAVPFVMAIANGIAGKMGTPTNYLCLIVNLFLLSCAMVTSYGMASGQRWVGTNTILVPFIVLCAGFLIGPVVGAFPGFFLAIGVVLGVGVAFAWARA